MGGGVRVRRVHKQVKIFGDGQSELQNCLEQGHQLASGVKGGKRNPGVLDMEGGSQGSKRGR